MRRNNHHDLGHRNSVCAFILPPALGCVSVAFSALLLFSGSAFAKGYSAGVTPAGATFGIKFASNGTPLATIGGTAGAVGVTQAVSLSLPGAVLPVLASAAISGASVAGAWGAAIGVLGAAALYAAPSIKEYMQSKGLSPSSAGALQRSDPEVCSTAPCYEYQVEYFNGYDRNWYSSAQKACTAAGNLYSSPAVANGLVCTINRPGWPAQDYTITKAGGATPQPAVYVPVTTAEAVSMLSSVPTSVGVVSALVDLSYPPATTQKTTTGPASVFKGNVVSLGVDGSVQEILSRYYVSYEDMTGGLSWNVRDVTTVTPPLITTSVSKAVTTLANGDTSTATTTTTTTTPQASADSGIVTTPKVETSVQTVVTDPQGKPVSDSTTKSGTAGTVTPPATAPVGSDPLEPPKDPCLANPLRVGCLEVDTPGGEIPKSSKTITYAEENVFGTGSCPANLTTSVGLLGKTVTVWDWQKTCELALPLRAIVLILASFAAFLIVMPGNVRT